MAPDETMILDQVPDPDEEGLHIRDALDADYEIIEELGRGGMAVVYHARERALDREVAIKVLPLARTFDSEFVQRFQREARLSASLEHPHIVPVYRVGEQGRVSYFVMKYLRGPSLVDLLETRGRLEPDEVRRLLLEVADALDHAHERGVVHRDIKPDNIMQDPSGRFVVMDFGIAKSTTGTQLTQTGGSIGTPKYMSPEQAKGADLDSRSDFYSLGVVAYHCLAGHPPFEADDPLSTLYAHLHEPVPEPRLDSDESRHLYRIVLELLAKDPGERLCGLDGIMAALEGLVPQRVAAPSSATHARRPAAAAKRWLETRGRRFWASSAAVIAVLGFALARGGAAAECRAALPDAEEDDRAVLLEPPGTVERGAEVQVAYVACGLSGDQPFTARITIGPADDGGVIGRVGRFFGGGSEPFRMSWDEEADGFATRRQSVLTPGDLEPGAYRLTVRIEDADGREAEARHDFTIVDP